ncbi:MAG: P-loop NTPase [Lachnospiraceae bacterium]|nr:P-loop NTPase [Lachnospiraceae bacterium]MBR0153435.1 P-loop NTPase [Lachnospiraceae bacterium]
MIMANSTTNPDFEIPTNPDSRVKKVIGVVSGKGGVGKSFVTSYLSVLMSRKGYRAAILDADITGPSIPKAFGVHEHLRADEVGIFPAESAGGVKMVSANLLLDAEDMPIVWRGVMIANAVKEFWSGVRWGDVDYMFVDMPPGTGDVPLTAFQSLPVDGILVVTSPQELVSLIVTKAVKMAELMKVPVIGLIENYSYVQCPDCGKKIMVFGESHVDEVAAKFGLPVLGKMPLDPKIAAAVDAEGIETIYVDWLDGAADAVETFERPVEEKQGEIVAIAVDEDGKVFQHFGKTPSFALYNVKDGQLMSKEMLDPEGAGHEGLVDVLAAKGVDVLICGGMGPGAYNALRSAGIEAVIGAKGSADVAIALYLQGLLKSSGEPNCDHHDHEHGEGEECCHGEGEGGCCGN